MGDVRKVNPKCVNAGNPYHECIEECYMKIANGKPRRSSFKNSGYQPSGNEIPKRVPAERRVNPKCPKASNPYHECGDHCSHKVGPPSVQRSMNRKESGSAAAAVEAPATLSRRTNKEQNHQIKPTPALDNAIAPVVFTVAPYTPPKTQSKVPEIEELEPEKNLPYSLPFSGNLRSEEFSFGKGQVKSLNSLPASGAVTPMLGQSPDRHAVREASFASITSSKEEEGDDISSENTVANGGVYHNREMDRSSSEEDEEEEEEEDVVSVASESRTQIGKYRVKLSISSILQSILTKYGDIAENCILESLSMRSYYLEMVCSVVQDLQSISYMTLNTRKVKEMSAIVKDLETARINVSWLRNILDQLLEISGFMSEHQAVKAAKLESDQGLELARKEMEVRADDLAKKEKEVEGLKMVVEETKQRLDELQAEAAQLEETVVALDSQIERFGFQALLQELL